MHRMYLHLSVYRYRHRNSCSYLYESESEVAQWCPTPCNPMDCSLLRSSFHGIFQQEYWSGLPLPAPEVLPDPGIEPRSPHCRQTLYCLSHQGSPSYLYMYVYIYIQCIHAYTLFMYKYCLVTNILPW